MTGDLRFRPLNVVAEKGSGVWEANQRWLAEPEHAALINGQIAPGFTPSAALNLAFFGGKVIPHLTVQLVFVDPFGTWPSSDQVMIHNTLAEAMSDPQLNSVISQYFPVPISATVRAASTVVISPSLNTFQQSDVETMVAGLHGNGTLTGDFTSTCFCFLLAPGIRLLDASGDDSYNGLGGYHGSVQVPAAGGGLDTVYYAVGVYSQTTGGQTNGIPVFTQSWQNVVATFYHELNEVRTDPDAETATTSWAGVLGWYSSAYGEVGDIPMLESAGDLPRVIVEVPLAGQAQTVPVQLMYSNRDEGPAAFTAGWFYNDVMAATGVFITPAPSGAAIGAFVLSGTHHVSYLSMDGRVHDLWGSPVSGWNDNDLIVDTGAPAPVAGSALDGYALGDGTGHVNYLTADGHVHELWWSATAGWNHNDLTGAAGAPPAVAGSPLDGYAADGGQHVNYLTTDGHVHELWWSATAGWNHNDLVAAVSGSGAVSAHPAGAGSKITGLAAQTSELGTTQHIYYIGSDGHVENLWWWAGPPATAEPGPFNTIVFTIGTGGDDLRGDSAATATLFAPDSSFPMQVITLKTHSQPGWGGGTTNTVTSSLSAPASAASIQSIVITLLQGGSWPETDDNWDVESVRITLENSTGIPAPVTIIDDTGNPLFRLTGSAGSAGLTVL
jgi:hypothetical protein